VEILGPKGPVSPGEPGRIVVTQLDNEAMPLVRYDLEDVAIEAAESEACACGRTLPLLESIEGRVPDLVVIPGGTFITSHFFVVLFKNIQRIHRYQIVQEEPGSIRVRLVPRQGCDRASVETTVSKDIAAATDHLLEPQFEWLDEIPLSGAGKRRLVISNVSRTLLGLPSTHRQTTE
jgi:phenylacetate-CoA ligase